MFFSVHGLSPSVSCIQQEAPRKKKIKTEKIECNGTIEREREKIPTVRQTGLSRTCSPYSEGDHYTTSYRLVASFSLPNGGNTTLVPSFRGDLEGDRAHKCAQSLRSLPSDRARNLANSRSLDPGSDRYRSEVLNAI